MTTTETTAPIGRYPYLADAGRQRDQLFRLLALESGEPLTHIKADRDPDVLEQLVDAQYVCWSVQGYGLTDRGRKLAEQLAELDRQHAAAEPTEQFDAVPASEDEAPAEQTGIMPAEGTLPGAPTFGRHRRSEPRTPSWLVVAALVVLAALDRLITRVAYRITRWVTRHARGLAWLVVAVPALAAGLVLGITGVLWLVTR